MTITVRAELRVLPGKREEFVNVAMTLAEATSDEVGPYATTGTAVRTRQLSWSSRSTPTLPRHWLTTSIARNFYAALPSLQR